MEFETLQYYFGNEQTIEIKVSEHIQADYIKFLAIDKKGVVSFRNVSDLDENQVFSGEVSPNDAVRLQNATESSRDYFAKIVDNDKAKTLVSIISFNKIPQKSNLDVGVGDIGISFREFKKNIDDNYLLEVGGTAYYVHGMHKNGSIEKMFSIIGTNNVKYDVILSRREECGALANREIANEQIWAIRKKESSYKRSDYNFELRELNLTFSDVSSVSAASEQNKLEMKNLEVDSVLGRWDMFADAEFELSKEKCDKLGSIQYSDYYHEESSYNFNLNCGKEQLDILKTLYMESGDGLEFEVYESLESVGAKKDATKKKTFVPIIKVLEIIGNRIKCFYDRTFIIPPSGFLIVSNYGNQMIYDRRKAAVERIRDSMAAKPNIALLIEGKPLHEKKGKKKYSVNDFRKEIMSAFGGRMPNTSQQKAIEIAINTPDFAIIQGPPGCGKTSLINAIDECLAKIDSTYHKRGASLSTAYQRESTKNMVVSKYINGIPVPFVSNSKDKVFIEKNFADYIADISDRLREKHPDLVEKIGGKTVANILTSYLARFNKETADYGSLIDFLGGVIQVLINNGYTENLKDLQLIKEQALKARERILLPRKSESLYFIRIIPESEIEYEDGGKDTFLLAKVNLRILRENFAAYLEEIEEIYEENPVDFERIQAIKNEMIFQEKNVKFSSLDVELNKKAEKITRKIKDRFENIEFETPERRLIEYVETFLNNPIKARQAFEPWVTSVAATHQISGDNSAIGQLPSTSERSAKYVEYNNVLIDEAARSCPPDLLIPISCAKNRIIMVGDHKQLPQFINQEVLDKLSLEDDVKKQMKNVSMFEYLIETTKKLSKNDGLDRFIPLNCQYRMPKVIGDFIGENFYPDINLESPRGNMDNDPMFVQTMPYISGKAMVWCDVPYGKETSVDHRGTKNTDEAVVVAKMLKKFLTSEDNKKLTVGVISFYKDQVAEIINELVKLNIYIDDEEGRRLNNTYKDRLQVDTVDAFQGLERDIIILSMVRSDPLHKFKPGSFGFLKDERHLCVALSRQKRCLVVVGNGSGMLETKTAESSVRALNNFYIKCKEGGDYIGFIESKNIV